MKRKSFCFKGFLIACLLLLGFQQLNLSAAGQRSGSGAGSKTDMVIYIEQAERPHIGKIIVPMLVKKFPEINFISKVASGAEQEKIIKTAFTAGDAIDISWYWPTQMEVFTRSNMALDLTPYLEKDKAWRDVFLPGALEAGKKDGKYVAIPYGTVYSCLHVNTDILNKAGVTVKDQWTWDEFLEACRKVRAYNPDIFPLGMDNGLSPWLPRNGFLNIWDTQAELLAFNNGDTPFTHPNVKKVFDNVKFLYDNKYLYPGEGALTATGDQVLSAFARGRIAMMGAVNSMVGNATKTIGGAFPNTVISWPNMKNMNLNYVLGGSDGYFIPANVKNPDKVVEVLKYLTSTEIMQIMAENGEIVPCNVKSSDPNYSLYGRDAGRVYPTEVTALSSEIGNYINSSTPANYILYGDQCITELEALRRAAKGR